MSQASAGGPKQAAAPLTSSFPKNFLREWRNIRPLLEQIARAHSGDLPPARKLCKSPDAAERAVYEAVRRHHDGMAAVRERMGLKLRSRSGKKSLRHWENLDAALKPLIAKLGHFPATEELESLGRHDVLNACERHHGGLDAVSRKYGYAPRYQRGERSLKKWKNLERELWEAIFLIGRFPSEDDLNDLGKGRVSRAIQLYPHGTLAVRKKFGVDSRCKKGEDSLRRWENYSRELAIAAKQSGGRFPSKPEFEILGKMHLYRLAKFFGGIPEARRRFEEAVARGEILLARVVVPKPAKPLIPKRITLQRLLDLYEIRFECVAGRIILEDGFARTHAFKGKAVLSGSSPKFEVAAAYRKFLPPISLEQKGETFSFDWHHAWLVSLLIQLSAQATDKREAVKRIQLIMQSASVQDKATNAFILLFDAYLRERDASVRKDMAEALSTATASKIRESFGASKTLFPRLNPIKSVPVQPANARARVSARPFTPQSAKASTAPTHTQSTTPGASRPAPVPRYAVPTPVAPRVAATPSSAHASQAASTSAPAAAQVAAPSKAPDETGLPGAPAAPSLPTRSSTPRAPTSQAAFAQPAQLIAASPPAPVQLKSLRGWLSELQVAPASVSRLITELGDHTFVFTAAQLYTDSLPPIPLQAAEGDFEFDSRHAWLVALAAKFASPLLDHRVQATQQVKQTVDSESDDARVFHALLVLRNAFMNEKDEEVERKMERVLGSKRARKFWKSPD